MTRLARTRFGCLKCGRGRCWRRSGHARVGVEGVREIVLREPREWGPVLLRCLDPATAADLARRCHVLVDGLRPEALDELARTDPGLAESSWLL